MFGALLDYKIQGKLENSLLHLCYIPLLTKGITS